jgi:hypothetical protein
MAGREVNIRLLVKIFIGVLISVWLVLLVISRGHPISYFDTRCRDFRQKDYSRRLNDRIVDYSAAARKRGINPGRSDRELRKNISSGRLVRVRSGRLYIVDRMFYSYPAITPESKILLDEIARRFREKAEKKGLRGSRFYITSMTRRPDNLKSLRRHNRNSSANSPHLYGNAFDISYKRFFVRKMVMTNCDKRFLKEALSEVIWEMRHEKRCWATYERMQNCFHVVSR